MSIQELEEKIKQIEKATENIGKSTDKVVVVEKGK